MKQFSVYFLALTLVLFGSTKLSAQTECPDIEWMRFYNSDNSNYCSIVDIDNYGNELVVGNYWGSLTLGAYNLPVAGTYGNTYIAKIDSTGSLLWINIAENFTAGSVFLTFSNPIVDTSGNIYTILNFVWKTVFAGTTYTTNPWQQNALFIKMNPQGQVLNTHLFEGFSLFLNHIDDNFNLYCSTNFEDTVSIDNQYYVSNGGKDILILKLTSQLQLLWTQQIGGNSDETNIWQEAMKVDSQNNVYVAGTFKSATLSLGNITLSNPYSNANLPITFMAKIGSNGQYSWGKSIPDPDFTLMAMEIDNSGNMYLAGAITDALTLGNTTIPAVPVNSSNSILIKYDPGVDSFSSMVVQGGWSRGMDVLYLPQKNMMVLSGDFVGSNIDFYIDTLTANNSDFYVLGVDLSLSSEKMLQPKWVLHSHGNGDELPRLITMDNEDNIYLSGLYSDDLGSGAFGNYTFPAISSSNNRIENSYQAKLSFLSREVTMDSSGRLSAVQDSAVYQWLDCGNGMQPVAGATSQSFQPAQPGSYAVRVSNSFCSVVSECISSTGISATDKLRQIGVYPNPVRETLYLSQLPLGTEIAVFDVLGRAVYSAAATKANLNISTRLWSPGVYMLRLSKDGATHLEKVVKE